jgi:hypothetical protein
MPNVSLFEKPSIHHNKFRGQQKDAIKSYKRVRDKTRMTRKEMLDKMKLNAEKRATVK